MDLFQTKLFQEAAKKVKFRIEAASEQNLEIFGQTWYSKHFTVGMVPHTVSEFKTILGNMHMDIAASTIQSKSAEPLRAFEGYEKIEQSMFTHAHAYRLEADVIRDMIMMVNTASKEHEQKVVDYIANKLFDITARAVQGVRSRLDIIILEALSNGGEFTFSATNDPQSPYIGQKIDFGMKAYHKYKVGSGNEWSAANVLTVDPLKDIDDIIKDAEVPLVKILCDRQTMRFILSTKAMKGYINNQLTGPNMPLSESQLNAWMAANGYPTFEVVNRKCLVQNGDTLSPYTPYKAGQLVFLPQEQIGTIETCLSDAELGMKSEGVEYSMYGRIEVRKYKLGEKENSDYTEITKASVIAAPSMDTIDQIYTLDTTL